MSDRSADRKEVVRVRPKVVSLHVHRNTLARRKRHELARALIDGAKALSSEKDLQGFVIVTVKDGVAEVVANEGEMDLDLFWSKVSKQVRYYEENTYDEEEDLGDA